MKPIFYAFLICSIFVSCYKNDLRALYEYHTATIVLKSDSYKTGNVEISISELEDKPVLAKLDSTYCLIFNPSKLEVTLTLDNPHNLSVDSSKIEVYPCNKDRNKIGTNFVPATYNGNELKFELDKEWLKKYSYIGCGLRQQDTNRELFPDSIKLLPIDVEFTDNKIKINKGFNIKPQKIEVLRQDDDDKPLGIFEYDLTYLHGYKSVGQNTGLYGSDDHIRIPDDAAGDYLPLDCSSIIEEYPNLKLKLSYSGNNNKLFYILIASIL